MDPFDIVITNGTILTMDGKNRILENGTLCIRGDSISRILSQEALQSQGLPKAIKTMDARKGLVLPGLVNGHTHAAMSLFRGIADDLPLMEWLNDYIFPAEKELSPDFVHTGTLLACAEMILSGTTTFCDMYLFEEETAAAAREAGMRAVVGEVLYDFPSPNYGPVEKGLAYTEDLMRRWKDDPLISIAVEPHSLFTCSPDLLISANRLALDHGARLIIHVAETAAEVDQVKEQYGRLPFEHLDALGILGPHLIADHCVHLDAGEMERISKNQVSVIYNPESNMKLASGIAPVPELLEKGVTVGLGTDGCASNNNLDLFTEMDTAAKVQKVRMENPTVMDAVTVMRMATIEGAKALGLSQTIGSIEEGKRADIIVVDTDKPHLTPIYNPYSVLVYAAVGSDVRHSIINGRLVMEDRMLKTLDLEKILEKAVQKARGVRNRLEGKGREAFFTEKGI